MQTCEHCGQRFHLKASAVAKGRGRFCSRSCVRAEKADRVQARPLAERFWRFVDKSGGPNACWPWTGGLDGHGYGLFERAGAHRTAYRLTHGEPRYLVLHHCDNPPCCNPKHLYDGTRKDNARDAIIRGQMPRGERHGHAVLTTAAARHIKWSTAPLRVLAARYRVSIGTICDIRKGRTWRHIQP